MNHASPSVGTVALANPGLMHILNVGDGDTKLSFDPDNPAERIRTARIVRDMLRRGYALLIEVEKEGKRVFTRALDFHEDVCEYVIADFDPVAAADADAEDDYHAQEQVQVGAGSAPAGNTPPQPKRRGRPPGRATVKAERARTVAVAPTAGG